MARLTKPQARIIGGNKPGEKLFSNPRINTNQRSIDTLVKHGHLRVTDRQPGGFTEYTVQDTPEVRACNAERDAAYAAIMAEPAAIAQPVSVATDAAPAYKAARGAFEWHEGDEPAEVSIRRLRDSAPDAAQTAAADAEPRVCDCGNDRVIPGTELCEDCRWAGQMYPHLFPEDHAQPAPDAVSETVTFAEYQDKRREIHELAHERDYLQREYDAISQAFDGYMKANAEREDATDDLQQYRGWINDLIDGLDHISPIEALTRLLSFRRDYQAYTALNAEAQSDAALVAARQRADDGTRLTTADVRAQSEFAEED